VGNRGATDGKGGSDGGDVEAIKTGTTIALKVGEVSGGGAVAPHYILQSGESVLPVATSRVGFTTDRKKSRRTTTSA
jgi:hypothetical protein